MKIKQAMAIGGVFFSLSVAQAKENVGSPTIPFGGPKDLTAACSPATQRANLEINNVRAMILNGGDMWWDQGAGAARYEVPKNSGKYSFFAHALWVGGVDAGGQLKTAAQTYRQNGNDFWPGALDVTNASIDGTGCSKWDKIYQVFKQDVLDFTAWYADPSSNASYSTPDRITNFPGNGDVTKNEDNFMAPFEDVNGDGIYQPLDGDYPRYDIYNTASQGGGCENFLFGDQTLFWVFNDKGNIHGESNGQPIGLEVRAQAFAFATNDEVNDMTFYQYQIYNRSSIAVTNTYFGSWNDPDLGLYTDDYIGCDVQAGLGFCYNGDDQDGTGSGNSYGNKPPCSAVDFFKGPLRDPDGIDNSVVETISGTGFGDGIVDNERLGMEYFMIFKNDASIQGNPSQATHFYNYLRSKWKDGTDLSFGMSGYGGSPATKFGFPWTSDPAHPGENWECSEVADWRFVHSAGPFTLKPGAVNFVTVGAVWAQAQSGGAKASVDLVRLADKKAQALFDNCFQVLEGPRAPEVTTQELNREIILYLKNPTATTFNNRYETYEEKDPLITDLFSVDTLGNQTNLTNYDKTYNFQGYLIYQVKDGNISSAEADLNDPTKARIAAQCDVKDNLGALINFNFDPAFNGNIAILKNPTISGYNKGIRHSFKITEDLFASGSDKRLVNFKTYYFIAVAYGANNFKQYIQTDPNGLDGQKKPYISGAKDSKGRSVAAVACIPRATSPLNGGTSLQSVYGSGPQIKRIEGQGNGNQFLEYTEETVNSILEKGFVAEPVYKNGLGPIDVKVIDPLNVPDGEFKLKFVSHALVPQLQLDNNGVIDSVLATDLSTKYVYANVPLYSDYFALQGISNGKNVIRRIKNIMTAVDTAAWVLTNMATNESVSSDTCINIEDEKLITEWGISIRITKATAPGVNPNANQNGYLGGSVDYADITKAWMFGFPDQEGEDPTNWIRSGTFVTSTAQTRPAFTGNDFKTIDDNQYYEEILAGGQGGFAPYILTSNEWHGPQWNNGYFTPAARKKDILKNVASIEVVITSDKSKWTRCPVIEMQDTASLSFGNALKFDLRKSPSVDQDGKAETGSTGMGWFPGYAINLETGERLNMAFGEDSWLEGENGRDMLWNPTGNLFTNGFDPRFGNVVTSTLLGGKHFLYVFGHNGNTPDDMPRYDQGEYMRTKLATLVVTEKQKVFKDCMWAMIPMTIPNTQFLNTDVKIRANVSRPYNLYYGANSFIANPNPPPVGFIRDPNGMQSLNPENGNFPMYSFGTGDLATIKGNVNIAKTALDLINVVPNPYFSYSAYELQTLDNIVKITNLPQACAISIYTVNGTLIRTFKKDNPLTFLDWDLKNQKNVPISSGLYLIHVNVPNVGEKVIKFFGTLRPIDLDQF